MIRKQQVTVFILYVIVNVFGIWQLSFAEPFLGEKGLVVESGLTDMYITGDPGDTKSEYKAFFNAPGDNIMYWAMVKTKTDGLDDFQEIEWYSPDGHLWRKESEHVFNDFNPFLGSTKTFKHKLKQKYMPAGTWAVRFIWNGTLVDEAFFNVGETAGPTPNDVDTLKGKIRNCLEEVTLSNNKGTAYKINSYLATEVNGYPGKQSVELPRISFKPDEDIVYTLNVWGGQMVLGPQVHLFLFSPDGAVFLDEDLYVQRDSNSVEYCAKCQNTVKFNKRKMKSPVQQGLWRLVAYYIDEDQIIDERYFYITDSNTPDPATMKEDIKALDEKIGNGDIADRLSKYAKNNVLEFRKKGERKITIKVENGMSKEKVLELFGQPDKIITDRYDDAEIFFYKNVEKAICNSLNYSAQSVSLHHGPINNGGDILSAAVTLVVTTAITAGVSALAADELEVVMRNDVVVGARGAKTTQMTVKENEPGK